MIPVDCTIQAVTSRNKVAVDLFRRIVQVSRGKLRTLRRVPARMFAVAAVTFALTVTVRLALWLIPFRVIRRFVEATPAVSFLQGKLTPGQIAWLLHVAGRNVFRATCLTQALTAQLLLNGAGLENQLHIGVAEVPALNCAKFLSRTRGWSAKAVCWSAARNKAPDFRKF